MHSSIHILIHLFGKYLFNIYSLGNTVQVFMDFLEFSNFRFLENVTSAGTEMTSAYNKQYSWVGQIFVALTQLK